MIANIDHVWVHRMTSVASHGQRHGITMRIGKAHRAWKCFCINNHSRRDFPDGPVVKNPPSSSGGTGSIPGQGTKIPHAVGQQGCVPQLLSSRASTREPACCKLQSPRALEPARHNCRDHVPQLERENPRATVTHMPQLRSRMPQLRLDAVKK